MGTPGDPLMVSEYFLSRFGREWARWNCVAPLGAFLGSGGLGTPMDPVGTPGDPLMVSHKFLSRFGREWARWNRAAPLGAFLGVWWFGDPPWGPLWTPGDPRGPPHGKSLISQTFWMGVGSLESCRPPGCVFGGLVVWGPQGTPGDPLIVSQ